MGQLWEFIKMAIENIKGNKGRSFLTMLGIIIGIASVIMIMAIGAGTSNMMNDELSGISNGLLYIYTSSEAQNNDVWITQEDIEAVQEKVSGVAGITPSEYYSGTVYANKGEFNLEVSAGNEAQQDIFEKEIKYGRYFSQSDVQVGRKVCVIGVDDAIKLFGTDDVIGMEIDVTLYQATQTFTIVGVQQDLEDGTLVTYSYSDEKTVSIDIPYTALAGFNIWSGDYFYSIFVIADNTVDSKTVVSDVIHLLESRHQSAGEEFFMVQDYNDMINQINTVMGVMTAFISLVAGISLLVGGIGVMNIMLVSVTERTREIGIRKALGAKTSSILTQFLAESAIITALGGIIGIILGILGAFGVCAILQMMEFAVTPGIQISTILLATLFSSCVGIFFGIYPARKAAKLSPIEALRRN